MYSLLLAVIYLAFISLGLPDSLLGSAWPVMQDALGVPISYAGIATMIISGSTIISSLMSERMTKRYGTKYVTLYSVLLTAAALLGFSYSHSFTAVCLWSIPYGLGAGAIDAALNNYVALYYSSRHMSWLHCFWGLGTVISPYIMSFALTRSAWQAGYRSVSFIQFAIFAVLLCTLPLWKVNDKSTASQSSSEMLGIRGALKIKGVKTLLVGFFAYCAAESTVMIWASSYLVRAREIDETTAAAFGSLFFIGITAGRFISGFVSEGLGDKRLIEIGTAIIAVGIVFVALPLKADIFALAGLILIGLGCAPIYPSVIHSTPSNFGAENSQAIIGIQMASAYVGSTFMPPVFGLIAGHVSIKLFWLYIAIFVFLMIAMIELTYDRCARPATAS